MNVFELQTGRPRIVNPKFSDLKGACEFPRWFEQEATKLLQSTEPYAIAAGMGLLGRFCPYVALNYQAVNALNDTKSLPMWHVYSWAERVASSYKNHIAEAYNYEVEDIIDSFGPLKRLYDRNAKSRRPFAQAIKLRRDDLENVGFICLALGLRARLQDADKLDALALTCGAFLNDEIRNDENSRLNIVNRYMPIRWWGR